MSAPTADDPRRQAAVAKAFIDAVNGKVCPVCASDFTMILRVGCCHRAQPCNHRLFGKEPPMWLEVPVVR